MSSMDFRIIKTPSAGALAILKNRMGIHTKTEMSHVDAVGLVQGKFIDMVCAADIAEKAVGVTVEDIRGTCPQHMVMLAIFGDTASVEAAIDAIRQSNEEGKERW